MPELKQPQIKYESKLEVGDKTIRCYILEDGRRILNQEDLENFFGMSMKELKKIEIKNEPTNL